VRPRFRCISAKMADDSLDESGKTLEPKYLTKQTLFPVIGASKSKGSGSLLFPCSSFKVDERAAGIGKGKGKFFPLYHDFFLFPILDKEPYFKVHKTDWLVKYRFIVHSFKGS